MLTLVILTLFLAMAQPRQEYLDFVALINPSNVDMRTALWSHFFPENINTRNPVIFEYKVFHVLFLGLICFLDLSVVAGSSSAVF